MPRTTTAAAAARKLTEAISKLIRAEVAGQVAKLPRPTAGRGRPTAAPKKRRTLKLSPKVIAQRKLQGKFMGLVRTLSAAKKAELKKLRIEKGYPAAIAEAKKLHGG